MSRRDRIPGMPAAAPNGGVSARPSLEVPAVELVGVNVSAGPHPRDPSRKAILIGPLVLALPFEPEAARLVAQGLTGVIIAAAGELPAAPPD